MNARSVALVLVATLLVSSAAGSVVAERDEPADLTPATVYVGEELDISGVEQTGGGEIGGGPVVLVGISGEADEAQQYVQDPTAIDFDGWATGGYDTDRDDDADIVVKEGRIVDVTVRNGEGENVTGDVIRRGEDVRVAVEFDFDVAGAVEVAVVTDGGDEITDLVTSGSNRIETSGGTVRMDLSERDEGTLTIRVTPEIVEGPTRNVTVELDDGEAPTPTPTPTAPTTSTTQPAAQAGTPTLTPDGDSTDGTRTTAPDRELTASPMGLAGVVLLGLIGLVTIATVVFWSRR